MLPALAKYGDADIPTAAVRLTARTAAFADPHPWAWPADADAFEKMEDWRRDHNEVRSHSAIGHNVAIAIDNPAGAISKFS